MGVTDDDDDDVVEVVFGKGSKRRRGVKRRRRRRVGLFEYLGRLADAAVASSVEAWSAMTPEERNASLRRWLAIRAGEGDPGACVLSMASTGADCPRGDSCPGPGVAGECRKP